MLDLQQAKDRVLAKVFSKSPWLFNQWVRQSTFAAFNDSPWNEMTKPVSECRLALITTGGVHLKSQVPFDNLVCHNNILRKLFFNFDEAIL